jgi:hypothetical protein
MLTDRVQNEILKELKKHVQYVYKVIETPNHEDICEKTFNEFSENGWELVAITDYVKDNTKTFKIIFRQIGGIFTTTSD